MSKHLDNLDGIAFGQPSGYDFPCRADDTMSIKSTLASHLDRYTQSIV